MADDDQNKTVLETLQERGKRYGLFTDNARVSQSWQDLLRSHPRWETDMPVDAKEALTVIVQKIARILNGDPNYFDNWRDIQGYAKLVEDRILSRGIYAEPASTDPSVGNVHEAEETVYDSGWIDGLQT